MKPKTLLKTKRLWGVQLKEVGKTILTIQVLTTKITCNAIKRAMEIIKIKDVDKWAENTLDNQTSLRGDRLFVQTHRTQKVCEKIFMDIEQNEPATPMPIIEM